MHRNEKSFVDWRIDDGEPGHGWGGAGSDEVKCDLRIGCEHDIPVKRYVPYEEDCDCSLGPVIGMTTGPNPGVVTQGQAGNNMIAGGSLQAPVRTIIGCESESMTVGPCWGLNTLHQGDVGSEFRPDGANWMVGAGVDLSTPSTYDPLVITTGDGHGRHASFTLHEGGELCGPFDVVDAYGKNNFHLDAGSCIGGTRQDLNDGKLRHSR